MRDRVAYLWIFLTARVVKVSILDLMIFVLAVCALRDLWRFCLGR